MRVLVVGSGGREHAICRALSTAEPRPEIWVAPGNPGTAKHGENVPVGAEDVAALVALARERGVDLVIPGPEGPLVAGLADRLRAAGVACFGPSAAAARLEGSKAFTRELGARIGLPAPGFAVLRHRD